MRLVAMAAERAVDVVSAGVCDKKLEATSVKACRDLREMLVIVGCDPRRNAMKWVCEMGAMKEPMP